MMGASSSQVIVLLSGSFTRLVLISFLVAAPIAYYGMSQWLQGFAYRIDIGVMTLLLGGASALLVAWATISLQALKAAKSSPVSSLRSE